ncbi:MAG: DUF4271 domain-containing protein [Bacteroidota bacterium]
MQGDITIKNPILDTNNISFVFCKPDTSLVVSKADSLQLQSDSLKYKYFFDYSYNHNSNYKCYSLVSTRKSMFTTHQLQVINSKPIERKEYANDWMVIILLICFSLIAWLLIFSRKRVKQIINATYSNRTINQLIRDGDLFKERIALAFTTIYLLSFSLFTFQIGHYYLNFKELQLYSFVFFLKILAVIIGLYLIKQRATKFIGIIFKNTNASYVYLLNGFIFNILTGIFLLPLLLFMIYSKSTISSFATSLSIGIVTMLSVVRYFRYIIIGVSFSKFSHFYLFLYLCTLEIIPILIIIKLIIGLIDNKL